MAKFSNSFYRDDLVMMVARQVQAAYRPVRDIEECKAIVDRWLDRALDNMAYEERIRIWDDPRMLAKKIMDMRIDWKGILLGEIQGGE